MLWIPPSHRNNISYHKENSTFKYMSMIKLECFIVGLSPNTKDSSLLEFPFPLLELIGGINKHGYFILLFNLPLQEVKSSQIESDGVLKKWSHTDLKSTLICQLPISACAEIQMIFRKIYHPYPGSRNTFSSWCPQSIHHWQEPLTGYNLALVNSEENASFHLKIRKKERSCKVSKL